MAVTIQDQIKDALRDAVIHRNFVVFSFIIVSIAILTVGAVLPSVYRSSTTIFVEEENILGPLMQGAAVQTDAMDRARSAREMILGRTIMMKLLQRLEFSKDISDPKEQLRIIDSIKSRTEVSTLNSNLVIRNGPRFSDSAISVFYPFCLRPDHAACGHSTLPV